MTKKLLFNKKDYVLDLIQTPLYMNPKEYVQSYSVAISDNGQLKPYQNETVLNNYMNNKGEKEYRQILIQFEYAGEKYYISNFRGTSFLAYKASDVGIENGGVLNSLLSHVYQFFTNIFRNELVA